MIDKNLWEELDEIYNLEQIQEGMDIIDKNAKHISISKPISSSELDWWKDEPDLYDDMVKHK